MAKLTSTISAVDSMSATLNRITDALDQTIEAFETLKKVSRDPMDSAPYRDVEDSENDLRRETNRLSDAIDENGESADKAEKKHSKLASAMKVVGAAAATAAAAAGAAALKLGKEVVKSYAEYEQLKGGVETLFGTGGRNLEEYAARIGKTTSEAEAQFNKLKAAESAVLKNADNAYMTTGLSANQYIDTVTGFSASLISSLGGDTKKAAQYADDAVRAMADNANKMGTDISSIQNAYQGFAKQNYTMLDNLKLGYGGTKEEMQRLLNDAEKISGMKFEMGNFADMTKAIQVIQDTMDITGTTLDEAKRTISGSINMTKAAFQNLITGLGNPDADVKQLAKNLVTSAGYVLDNITPVIENIVAVLPIAVKKILGAAEKLLPSLLDSVVSLFDKCLNMISKLLPRITPIVISALMTLVSKVVSAAPALMSAATKIVVSLITGISSALPELLPLATEAIMTIVVGLIDSYPELVSAGLSLLEGLSEGLMAALPILVDSLPQIVDSIVNFLENNYDTLLQTGIDLLIQLIEGLPTVISDICSRLPEIIHSIVSALLGRIDTIVQCGVDLLIALIQNAGEIVNIVIGIVPEIITALVNSFAEHWEDIKRAGLNLIDGLWSGLKEAWAKVKEWVGGLGHGVVDTIKGIFRINSPSKVMAELGGSIGEGFALGITNSTTEAVVAADKMAKKVMNATEGIGGHTGFDAAVEGITTSVIETKAYVAEEAKLDEKDMELMQEIAEREAINKFTTKKINVDFSGMNNNFTSDIDAQDWLRDLRETLEYAYDSGSEGGE